MSSWNRRVAAASRVREATDPEGIDERLHELGLPTGVHADDAAALSALLRVAEGRGEGFSTTLLARLVDDDGHPRQQLRLLVLGEAAGATVFASDPAHDLDADAVTGLPGRDSLLASLDLALAQQPMNDHVVAVYSIDIDRFKTINDTKGFDRGDDTLRALAARLLETLRVDDVLTRFGGDEFVILCPAVGSVAEAMELGERFRTACANAPVDSVLYGLTVSIGIAIADEEHSSEELLHQAETALYQAKTLGRDRCALYDHDLRSVIERRQTIDHELRVALEHDTLDVHYQPIVALPSHQLVGCEALLRISGDDGMHLDPRELVGAAEDAGLIRRVEERVLEQAATAIQALPLIDGRPLHLSLNISEQRLNDSRFPLALARGLHAAGLPAEQVHLEVHPEALASEGLSTRLVTQLRALGVRIVVDGFLGTCGLESIDTRLVDLVKLDRRLVQGIQGPRGRARMQMVVDMVRDRQVELCAVGVETDADLLAVTQMGCGYAQGFVLAPPMRADDLAARLRA